MELKKEIEILRESVRQRIVSSRTDPTELVDTIKEIDAILNRHK